MNKKIIKRYKFNKQKIVKVNPIILKIKIKKISFKMFWINFKTMIKKIFKKKYRMK